MFVDKGFDLAEILPPEHPTRLCSSRSPRPRRCRLRLARSGAATVPPHDHLAFAGDAAAREIIAGVALWGGQAGLEELAADLALQLSGLIEQLAAVQGRSAVEVAEDLVA